MGGRGGKLEEELSSDVVVVSSVVEVVSVELEELFDDELTLDVLDELEDEELFDDELTLEEELEDNELFDDELTCVELDELFEEELTLDELEEFAAR